MTTTGWPTSEDLAALVQIEDGRIDGAVYADNDIFAAEMERIFHRTWLYVAHESEIPEPGDYLTLILGCENCIVCRDSKGSVRVLRNTCRHRGAKVCNDECGNATFFRCGYHGWTYRNDGSLIGVPYPSGYGDDFSREQLGLTSLALVESYRGLIFASFSGEVPPLEVHLKDVRPFIDRFIDQCAPYEIGALNGAQKMVYRGNWKSQLENAPDTYHAHATHRSFVDVLDRRIGDVKNMYNADDPTSESLSFEYGHCVIDRRRKEGEEGSAKGRMWNLRRRLDTGPNAEQLIEDIYKEIPEDADRMLTTAAGVGSIVIVSPNLVLNGIHIRQIVPQAADRTVLRNVVVNPIGAPDAVREIRLRAHEFFFGPAGFAAPDDFEMFERVQLGVTGSSAGPLTVQRGVTREHVGSGVLTAHGSDETTIRNQYREWLRLMS